MVDKVRKSTWAFFLSTALAWISPHSVQATNREVLGGHEGWLDRMGAGIRELGMGNTGTASEAASPGAYWNPALLAFGRGTSAGMGADMRSLQRNGGFLSLQGRAAANLGIGVGVLNRGDYEVVAYDEDEKLLGTARPQSLGTYLGFGFKTSRSNGLGVSLQWYYSNLDVADGIGSLNHIGIFNLGWYRIWHPAFKTAVSIRNLGMNPSLSTDMELTTLRDEDGASDFDHTGYDFFPKTFVAAASYTPKLLKGNWDLNVELLDYQLKDKLFVVDGNFHHLDFRSGVNYRIGSDAEIRAGYDRGNLAFGFSYLYQWTKRRKVHFDYAMVLEQGLLTVNPFAFGVRYDY